MPVVRTGQLLIADISRYTCFLAESELDHAQAILNGLFHAILEKVRPPFEVSSLQGDAVFAFCRDPVPEEGGSVLDAIESIYFSFLETLQRMQVNSTCECRACANMQDLDLKLILHHGEFLEQAVRDKPELSGRDVIVCHRLLKNSVSQSLGVRGGYALLTLSAIRALRLEEAAKSMQRHSEEYEHLGTIPCFVHELTEGWKRYRARKRIVVSKEEADLAFSLDLPLPVEIAWEYLQRPGIKALLQGATEVRALNVPGGRTGTGTLYHCAHGAQSTRQTIVDWRPYEYFSVRDVSLLGPLRPAVWSTYIFEPLGEGGTRVTFRMSRPRQSGFVAGAMVGFMWSAMVRSQVRQRFGSELRERLLRQIRLDQASGLLWNRATSDV